jgi:hypothetical protein
MLETYFSASKMLEHLRSGPSGPYLDGFAAALERQDYSAGTAVRYLRAAAHLGHIVAQHGQLPSDMDLAAFSEHRALVDARALREDAVTTTPFSALGSFASTLSKSAFAGPLPRCCMPSQAWWLTSRRGCASTAGRPSPPSSSIPATPRI